MIEHLFRRLFSIGRLAKRAIQMAADFLLIITSYIGAMNLRLDGFGFISDPEIWYVLIAVIPVTLLTFYRLRLYRIVVRYLSANVIISLAIGVGISAATMLLVSQLFRLPVPRSVPFIYLALLFLSIGGVRFILRLFHQAQFDDNRQRIAVYGAGNAGRQLVNALRYSGEYKPVLFIDDDHSIQGTEIGGLSVFSFANAKVLLKERRITAILVTIPSLPRSVRKNIVKQLEEFPVEVKTLPGMADLIENSAQMPELRNVSIEELLGRDPVPPKPELMERNIRQKVVLVSGAGGSIGSELCRQIITLSPSNLLLLDVSEYALYTIHEELTEMLGANDLNCTITPLTGSAQNEERILKVLNAFHVDTIFHAAAYKHVPLVEFNIVEGIQNNTFATWNLARCAVKAGVENFILISTDKAVRPTNFMGASKRLAELICQAFAKKQSRTRFSMVRFGNVLGSSGSVIPRFKEQIKDGGPVTVTHKEINRYFMTIPEAAQLVIQAGSMAKGGDVFVLDMGKPIKIIDLAKKMIRLHGLVPFLEDGDSPAEGGDIAIRIIGLRPGEKLYEELLIGNDPIGTKHPRILTASEKSLSLPEMEELLEQLGNAIKNYDLLKMHEIITKAPVDFEPLNDEINDAVWQKTSASPQKQRHLKLVKNI